jgi:hypothetical protein
MEKHYAITTMLNELNDLGEVIEPHREFLTNIRKQMSELSQFITTIKKHLRYYKYNDEESHQKMVVHASALLAKSNEIYKEVARIYKESLEPAQAIFRAAAEAPREGGLSKRKRQQKSRKRYRK